MSEVVNGNKISLFPTSGLEDLSALPVSSTFIPAALTDSANYKVPISSFASKIYTQQEFSAVREEIGNIGSYVTANSASTAPEGHPDVTDPSTKVIYLVYDGNVTAGQDKYNEWIWNSLISGWQKIGDTSMDLSGYLTKDGFSTWSSSTASTFSGTSLSAVNSINLSGIGGSNIINSAISGQEAYNILSSTKYSAATTGTVNYSELIASGFCLSAGDGIDISGSNKIIKVSISSDLYNSLTGLSDNYLTKTAFSNWSGNTASTFSGTSLSAVNSINLSGIAGSNIIESASNGQLAYDILSTAKYSANSTTNTGYISGGFCISAGDGIGINYTASNKTIKITAVPYSGASGIKVDGHTISLSGDLYNSLTGLSNNYLTKSAFSNWSGSSNSVFSGKAVSAISAENSIKLNGVDGSNIINSAKNGQSAYNWISANTDGNSAKWAKSATSASTAYNAQTLGGVSSADIIGSAKSGKDAWDKLSTATFTANGTTAKLSGGFNLSAGQGITIIHNAGESTIGISAEGTSYTTGRGIDINGKVISVKDEFVPWSASEINLPNTSNTALNTAFSHGLNNTANSESFAQGLENSANTYSIAQGKYNKAYNCAQAFGDNNIIVGGMAIGQNNKTSADVAFVIGNGTDNNNRSDLFLISGNGDIYATGDVHMAGQSIEMSYGNSTTTISLTGVSRGTMGTSLEVNWSDLVGKNFVYASTNASGSILSADNKVTLVVTATLPTVIPSGHYFIV